MNEDAAIYSGVKDEASREKSRETSTGEELMSKVLILNPSTETGVKGFLQFWHLTVILSFTFPTWPV